MTVVLPETTKTYEDVDDLLHWVCGHCHPDPVAPAIAACGAKVTQPAVLDAPAHEKCIVCVDLVHFACRGCGL